MSDAAAETVLRARWRVLVEEELPAAAAKSVAVACAPTPGWPVSLDHCFARILLDNALGRPWRELVRPPAWRNMPGPALREAVRLGEAVLAGQADLAVLNRRSLSLRGRRAP